MNTLFENVGKVGLENGQFAAVLKATVNVGAGATDTAIVAAVTGKKIRVLGFNVLGGAAGTFVLNTKPAGAGSAISAVYAIGTTLLTVEPKFYLCDTTAGQGLSATTTGGGATAVGVLTYCLV
jgi:hypothetical protein